MIGFTPTGTGSRSSVLSFLTSPCDTLRRIVLRGGRSGVIPPILTQDSIDFGRITACAGLPQSRDSTIRIVNNGTEDVVLGGLETPTPFRFCGLQAPTLIPAGDSVSLCIGFSPTGEGTFRRIVSLPYRQGACRDTLRLVVTGELVAPLLSTDSLRIDVGSIGPCSIIDTIGVLLRNRSAIGITVDSVDGGESIEPIDFDAPLGIGADDSTRLKLRLRPRAAGPFSYPVHFFYGPCGDTLTIIIEGEAIGIVPLLEKERIDFGKILACSPPQLLRDTTRLLLSGGAGEVTVTSARLIADSGRISVEGLEDFAGQTVGSSGLTIPVTFADSSFRISHDTLEIVLAPCGDTILLPIVAEAVFPALAITSGQFGQVEVDAERALPIVVENISGVPLEVTIEHLPPEPYRVDTTGLNLPRILAPGEFVALPSRLAPTRSGFYTDSIGLSVAQGCSYRRTIRLDGEGTNPVVTGTFCLRGLHGQQSRSGDTVEVPITGGGGIQTGEPVDVLFDVVYDPMRVEMLSPLVGSLSDDDPATGRATVEILGATTFPDDLPVLRLRLLAGERPFTTIALDSVRLVGGSALRPLVCDTLAVVGIGHRCIVSGVSLGRFATRLRPIRPNPVRGQLTLSFDQLEDIRTAVVIVDGTGREVLRPLDAEMLGGSYELLVDVTELPAGLYFVRLTSGSFDEVERFVVPD